MWTSRWCREVGVRETWAVVAEEEAVDEGGEDAGKEEGGVAAGEDRGSKAQQKYVIYSPATISHLIRRMFDSTYRQQQQQFHILNNLSLIYEYQLFN
jgi:hypothetical protein